MLRALFIFFNLSAQTIDVDHDRIVINGNRIAPDMFIDHIFGKYLLRVFQEEKKKCTFFGRKDQLFPVFIESHRRRIITERTGFQYVGTVQNQILVSADQRFYFGSENQRTERLGNVVIGTEGKTVQGIIIFIPSADDHNRSADTLASDLLDHFETFHIAQHNVH